MQFAREGFVLAVGEKSMRVAFAAFVLLAITVALRAQAPPPQGRGGFVAYPPRAVDAAAAARGKTLYGTYCTFCHGADAHGGDGGGPSLLRSLVVLDDQKGELMGPIVKNGQGAMSKIPLSDAQIADLAEYLHSFPISSRTAPSTIDILVGDRRAGEAFVTATCASCHSVDKLKAFATRVSDDKTMQQMWLMPGSGGRSGRGGAPAVTAPAVKVSVTLPSGEKVDGTLVGMDDFVVSLKEADGTHRSFRTFGTAIKVDIQDPLEGHKALLPKYKDADIHNVTAYLASLRDRP
jgi:cytochrome c oxidase cbb3-type subunit 3